MLIFNSKLDNSISGTLENVNNAILAYEKYITIKDDLKDITNSNILQSLLDSKNPTSLTADNVRDIILQWRDKKAPGKVTWCSKRGLINNYQLTDLALLIKNNVISFQEYNLILLSKIWISDEKTPAVFTPALKVLSMVDNTIDSLSNGFVRAYSQIMGKQYSSEDFHSAELQQFCSIVSASGLISQGISVKDFINKWDCDFESISKPLFGFGRFPDFNIVDNIYSYVGNTNNGIYELEFGNSSSFNEVYPNIPVRKNNSKDMQKIYYGAPGTGKSDSIDRICKSYKHYRVTFHPDSDYSSFVGCYKPSMANGTSILNKGELINKLTEIKTTGVSYPCHKFAAKYWESLLAMSPADIKDILSACSFTDSMNIEISKGVAIGQAMANDGVDKKITYSFTAQAFTNAYIKAWKLNASKEKVYLIIEEINRGNCAQIFGDLFQLLDRGVDGYSKYEINPDTELQKYIDKQGLSVSGVTDSNGIDISVEINSGKLLKLPDNLYIWATMNTSDQSLFPIDSAFKRRWDWKYIKITDGYEKGSDGKYVVDASGKKVRIGWCLDHKVKDPNDSSKEDNLDWWAFIQQINKIISNMTSSADKQLGYFFCKADQKTKVISVETFVSKVVFYLWNDVFKDYGFEDDKLFKYKNKKGVEDDLTFPDFYDEEGNVDKDVVNQFIDKVMAWKPADNKND